MIFDADFSMGQGAHLMAGFRQQAIVFCQFRINAGESCKDETGYSKPSVTAKIIREMR